MDPTRPMLMTIDITTGFLDPITTHKTCIARQYGLRWLTSEADLYDYVIDHENLMSSHLVLNGSESSIRVSTWFTDYSKRVRSALHDLCVDRTDLPTDLQGLVNKFLR